MLTLTPEAQNVVRHLTDRPDAPEGGLRIAADADGAFALSLATAPEPGDQVVDSSGAQVYLDAAAATALDDQTLDASVDGEGQVAFTLTAPR